MPFEKVSTTLKNLESALAGESQAHIKYRYFAKIAREEGYEEVAKHFEHTADQELLHAWGHLELLIGKPSTKQCLEKAIEGETYEFTTMYPEFEASASAEGNQIALNEFRNQIVESAEHAEQFKAVLVKAEKRFAALKKIEERHANAYRNKLDLITFPVI
jgi:rubrerythrin